MTVKERILQAALATDIPEGSAGQWAVRKAHFTKPILARRGTKAVTVPAGHWTYLFCWTEAEINKAIEGDEQATGECVMLDTPDELQTHLDFMLRARGRVLITGLGLGCAARGCLANPAVKSVTVIERSPDVLKLVAPWMPKDKRLNIVRDDAIRWARRSRSVFDCAWHDLWSDPDKQEPHLQLMHTHLICALHRRVNFQGAWAMPRDFRRVMKRQAVI